MWGKLIKYILAVYALLLFASLNSSAAENNDPYRVLKDNQWEQLTDDPAFAYRSEREYVMPKERSPFEKFWAALYNFFNEDLGRILLWSIIFGIAVYMLYYIVFSKNGNFLFRRQKRIKQGALVNPAQIEDISHTDWDVLVTRAITSGNYRDAIRYSYLRMLQLLQEHELIVYKDDKTNFDYYTELGNSSSGLSFRQLSRQYEYAWYGHFSITRDVFDQYMEEFERLKKQLK